MKRIFCALLAGALTLGAALPVQAADVAVLRVAADAKQTAISDHLYGAFIEDISYACDGGLVSNLVNNDSFEYASAPTTGWVADGLELTTEGDLPLNKNNPTYAKVTVDGKGSLTNLGFTEIYKYKTDKYDKKKANTADMGFVADQVYDFSCYGALRRLYRHRAGVFGLRRRQADGGAAGFEQNRRRLEQADLTADRQCQQGWRLGISAGG